MSITITSDTLLLNTDGHARVTAGPGAGKTHWLVQHIRNVLCRSKKLHPHARIAVITYTNVAADQLCKRLGKDAACVDVSTIHSFLYQNIVRPYLHLIRRGDGQPLVNIQLLEGHDEHHVHHQKLEAWLSITGYRQVIRDKEQTAILKKTLGYIRWAQAENPANWQAQVRPPQWLYQQLWKPIKERLTPEKLFVYKTLYWNDGDLDHDDVLYFANRLLAEYPSLAIFLSARYPFLFIDEFQDTVPAQTTILRNMAEQGTTIVVIGDAEQSIFAFAGAEPDHFSGFMLPGMDDYQIKENRRSSDNIVRLLNHVRRDGLLQHGLRGERGFPVTMLVGPVHEAAQHAKGTLEPEQPLLILGRYDSTVRTAYQPSTSPHPWDEMADMDRKIFLEHLFAGLVLAQEKRFNIANKTVLKGIRHRSDDTLRNPLQSDRPRPDLHRRAISIVILQTLVRIGPSLATMKLRQAYDIVDNALATQFGDIRLTKISGKGDFAKIADQYSCGNLLRTVKIRNSEEVRQARTIHKAKGAEEENVLVCLHGKTSADSQARLNHIIHPASVSDEEHRVTYVAISRARNRLFLASPSLLPEEEVALQTHGLSIVRLASS